MDLGPIGDYTPNVAIVTGAAQGIGRSVALRLADDGFEVAVNDVPSNSIALQEVVDLIKAKGKKAIGVTGDVSVEADVERLITETVEHLGGVDAMVANAGITGGSPFLQANIETFDRVIAVNLRGVMLCYLHASRQMVKQRRGGRLIAASSVFGKRGVPLNQAYCASKFAVRGLSQSVAKEMIPYKITCNTYAPGLILTSMKADLPRDKLVGGKHGTFVKTLIGGDESSPDAPAEVVASMVSYLCKSEAYFITGESISVCGGLLME